MIRCRILAANSNWNRLQAVFSKGLNYQIKNKATAKDELSGLQSVASLHFSMDNIFGEQWPLFVLKALPTNPICHYKQFSELWLRKQNMLSALKLTLDEILSRNPSGISLFPFVINCRPFDFMVSPLSCGTGSQPGVCSQCSHNLSGWDQLLSVSASGENVLLLLAIPNIAIGSTGVFNQTVSCLCDLLAKCKTASLTFPCTLSSIPGCAGP